MADSQRIVRWLTADVSITRWVRILFWTLIALNAFVATYSIVNDLL